MKKILPLLFILTATLMMTGCGKDNDNNTPPVDSPSIITITTPPAGTIFINGSTLQVRGNVTDNNALSNARIEIRNTTTNAILYQQNQSTGNVLYYDLNWNWTVTGITSTVNAMIRITVTDRYNYQVTKEVAVVLVD